MSRTGKVNLDLAVVGVLLAAIIFVVDLSLPLGVAGGVPYVALVLIGLWASSHALILALATVGTVLTILGCQYSPEGGIPWMVLTNRGLALSAIWITAILIIVVKRGDAARRHAEMRLLDAIEILPDGFFIWDSDDRLVLNNEAYRRMFAICEPVMKPGVKFEEVVRYGAEHGLFPEPEDDPASVEQIVAEHRRKHRELPSSDEERLADGRWFKTNRVRARDGGIVGTRVDVTEIRRVNAELKDSENRNANILRSALDGIVTIDEEGRIVVFNPAAETMFGYRREEVLGKQMAELIIPPHLRDEHRQGFKRYLETGQHNILSKHIEISAMRADGEEFQMELTIVPSSAGPHLNFTAFCRDITARKEMQEALRRQSVVWRQMREGVLVIDLEDRIVDCNPGAERIYGYPREELLGMPAAQLVKEGTRGAYRRKVLGYVARGEQWEDETVVIKKNGAERVHEVSIMPLHDEGGHLIGTIGMNRDVTGRKRAEQEKAELEKQLRHAQKMEAVGTLAGGVAHDFNNILQGIMGHASIAGAVIPADSGVRANLDQISQAANHGKEVVRQLLAFSRNEEPSHEPLGVERMFNEALPLIEPVIAANIELQWHCSVGPETVLAEPTQIHQVLINLCSNSADAIGDEPGVIVVSAELTEIGAGNFAHGDHLSAGQYVALTVADTGCGMDEQTRERIFDPFFTTKGVSKGTGLGLASVYGIVRDHGGRVDVESEPGKGARFTILLPCKEADVAGPEALEQASPDGSERILLVDDEEMIVEVYGAILERFGYTVTAATDAAAALAIFRSDPDGFDLVVTDQVMSGMNGEALARELTEIRPGIPIILCTGYFPEFRHARSNAVGIREVIEKPVEPMAFGRAVRRVLDQTGEPENL